MCGKCQNTPEKAAQAYQIDWAAIPAQYTEVRISRMGSLWAVGATDRLKLTLGEHGGGGLGLNFRGGLDSPIAQGWAVVETRPAAKALYILNVPGRYLDGLGPLTSLEAEAALLAAGPGAYLYEVVKSATVHEIRTTTTEVVWSK
jgi:hypothetical protein